MKRFVVALAAVGAVAIVAGSAAAADLPVKAVPVAPEPHNWTGLYIGANAGWSWGNQDISLATPVGTIADTVHPSGFIGGGQIGYNWQYNEWVLGLEADIQGSGQKDDGGISYATPGVPGQIPGTAVSISYTDKLTWFGTVRGRIGWATDRWMPYLTGGWAYGHGEFNGTWTATTGGLTATSAFNANKDYSGWTIGGGLEWAFRDHWSAKLEYLYIDFGDGPDVPITATQTIVTGNLTDHILRVGLNYRF